MKGDGVDFCRKLGRCGEDLRSPLYPSGDFHYNQTSKNHSHELLQEARGDLQEVL